MKMILAFGAALALAAVAPAAAAVTQIMSPDAGYIGATTLLPIAVADFTSFSSLSSGGFTVSSSGDLEARTVGSGWATWGLAPDTEGSSPRIGYSDGATSLTFSFDRVYSIFGFEAEGNPFDVRTFTVEYFLGGVSQGLISRDISGNAGARLLAASGTFDRAIVSSDVDFALGQFRVAAGAVPEPTSWAMLVAGFGLVGATMRRRAAATVVTA